MRIPLSLWQCIVHDDSNHPWEGMYDVRDDGVAQGTLESNVVMTGIQGDSVGVAITRLNSWIINVCCAFCMYFAEDFMSMLLRCLVQLQLCKQ